MILNTVFPYGTVCSLRSSLLSSSLLWLIMIRTSSTVVEGKTKLGFKSSYRQFVIDLCSGRSRDCIRLWFFPGVKGQKLYLKLWKWVIGALKTQYQHVNSLPLHCTILSLVVNANPFDIEVSGLKRTLSDILKVKRNILGTLQHSSGEEDLVYSALSLRVAVGVFLAMANFFSRKKWSEIAFKEVLETLLFSLSLSLSSFLHETYSIQTVAVVVRAWRSGISSYVEREKVPERNLERFIQSGARETLLL
jgi:hypothetical protein